MDDGIIICNARGRSQGASLSPCCSMQGYSSGRYYFRCFPKWNSKDRPRRRRQRHMSVGSQRQHASHREKRVPASKSEASCRLRTVLGVTALRPDSDHISAGGGGPPPLSRITIHWVHGEGFTAAAFPAFRMLTVRYNRKSAGPTQRYFRSDTSTVRSGNKVRDFANECVCGSTRMATRSAARNLADDNIDSAPSSSGRPNSP